MANKKIKPSKIICIGLNYKKHAKELNMEIPEEPIIFLKPPTTIIYDNENIVYPVQTNNLHYEAEIGIVMGKENSIAGYVCANDVTARDLQAKDGQWTRAKSFNTFCPISKNMIEADKIDPTNLNIKAILNDKIVQNSNTSDMIFNVYEIVSFVSQIMTLYPEDLILTGTPEGVGSMQKGDKITIEIEGIGALTNIVC